MEYIKKEELIIGEIYTHQNGNICRCDQVINDVINGKHLGNSKNSFRKPPENPGSFIINEMRLATSEEKHWLNTCIEQDKFITFEEAMKTFIPEYVECIASITDSFTKNKIYKIENFDNNRNFNILDNDNDLRGVLMTGGLWLFKPSTKEAYDAQFIVKEPEFVLPEKWCIKDIPEVKDFFQKYNNSTYTCRNNAYLHYPRINAVCYFTNIQNDYIEITFEQFKKYVLKEETAIEFGNKVDKEIIEPLPQFKVIESIETITKVENNEGNQFFIGDVVKSSPLNIIHKITGFKYDINKTIILALTDKVPTIGVGINKLEHYIEPKVEIKDEFILPEKWCIEIKENSKENICNWFQKNCQNDFSGSYKDILKNGEYMHYPVNRSINSHRGFEIGKIYHNYTEITFDQFKKYVLKEEIKEETLLEKTKRLYPVGTKFHAARGNKGYYKVKSNSEFKKNPNGAICIESQKNGTIYFDGIWAEIIK